MENLNIIYECIYHYVTFSIFALIILNQTKWSIWNYQIIPTRRTDKAVRKTVVNRGENSCVYN